MMYYMPAKELKSENIKEIAKLWNSSFGDSFGYINYIIDNIPHNSYVLFEKNAEIVSFGINLLTGKFKGVSLVYLYAGCVNPEYRGKGYFENIHREIKSHYNLLEYGLMMFVFNPGLIRVYDSYGFNNHYHFYSITLNKNDTTNHLLKKELLGIDSLNVLSNDFRKLYGFDCPESDSGYLLYVQKEKSFCGDPFDTFVINNRQFYIIGSLKDNHLIIEDSNLTPSCFVEYINELCALYNVDSVTLRMPYCVGIKKELTDLKLEYQKQFYGQGTIQSETFWFPYGLC